MEADVAANNLPTPEELHNLLRYEPETGKLYSRRTGREVFTNTKNSGYKKGAIKNRTFSAHRVAAALHTGQWPEGEVDHINGRCDDNRWSNLRITSKSDNQKNARRRSDNSSGCCGVSFKRSLGKWMAYVNHNGRRIHLGYHAEKFDAVLARLIAAKRLGYTYRHGVAA
jgi:hypothetical protein